MSPTLHWRKKRIGRSDRKLFCTIFGEAVPTWKKKKLQNECETLSLEGSLPLYLSFSPLLRWLDTKSNWWCYRFIISCPVITIMMISPLQDEYVFKRPNLSWGRYSSWERTKRGSSYFFLSSLETYFRSCINAKKMLKQQTKNKMIPHM